MIIRENTTLVEEKKRREGKGGERRALNKTKKKHYWIRLARRDFPILVFFPSFCLCAIRFSRACLLLFFTPSSVCHRPRHQVVVGIVVLGGWWDGIKMSFLSSQELHALVS